MDTSNQFSGFHGNNLRKGRVSIPGQVYFVTTVTKDRLPYFNHYRIGRLLIKTFQHHQSQSNVDSLAFVIMPDHVHWLFSLGDKISLSALIGSVKQNSAKMINRELSVENRFIWQKGFHDHALRKEEDIKSLARYIIANPLRAGLVTNIGDYPLWDAKWL